MNTAVVNIKTDPKIKKQAQEVARELGFSLSTLLNGYLRELVRTKKVRFELSYEPSDYLIKSLKQNKKDIKNGFVSPSFSTARDAIKWLDDPKARYKNGVLAHVSKTVRKSRSKGTKSIQKATPTISV